MKNLTLGLMTAFMLFLFFPSQMNAETKTGKKSTTTVVALKTEEINAKIDRLKEIKAMKFSTLKPAERKELRKEVRSIRNELRAAGNSNNAGTTHHGLYISLGAAIIIALLLIILL
jgi:tetrahydromethanopterin S-methyltransferase subunit B